jgi:transcriptional regulator with XRE-family HTH domain
MAKKNKSTEQITNAGANALLDLRAIVDAERERQGLTDYALAKRAACSAVALRQYLNGDRECRSDVLTRLLFVLGLTVTPQE